MTAATIRIVTFDPQYRSDFAQLNYAWITQLFAVEPEDQRLLDDPENEIIAHGGQIFFALNDGRVAGTVALKREDATTFELTKMAVAESMRGHGYGKLLLESALQYAREQGAKAVVLSSHTSLTPALEMYRQAGFIEREMNGTSCYSRCNTFLQKNL